MIPDNEFLRKYSEGMRSRTHLSSEIWYVLNIKVLLGRNPNFGMKESVVHEQVPLVGVRRSSR